MLLSEQNQFKALGQPPAHLSLAPSGPWPLAMRVYTRPCACRAPIFPQHRLYIPPQLSAHTQIPNRTSPAVSHSPKACFPL